MTSGERANCRGWPLPWEFLWQLEIVEVVAELPGVTLESLGGPTAPDDSSPGQCVGRADGEIGSKNRHQSPIRGVNIGTMTARFCKKHSNQALMSEYFSDNWSLLPLFSYTFPGRPSFLTSFGSNPPWRTLITVPEGPNRARAEGRAGKRPTKTGDCRPGVMLKPCLREFILQPFLQSIG